jgi:predicted nucleotidyltransferase
MHRAQQRRISDVDLLVVMSHEGSSVRKAIEIRLALDAPFPLDLLVRDPEVLKHRAEQGDFFLREVVEKGQVLYEAADTRMDPKGRW